jgi:hypothetical protein
MKKQENKSAESPTNLVIEGSIDYKLTISKEGYELETKNSIDNDLAAMLHARGIIEMLKKDSEMIKASPIRKMMKPDEKKEADSKYNKLIHASYIIGEISGKLLTKAMIANDKKA